MVRRLGAFVAAAALACGAPEAPLPEAAGPPRTAWVEIAGELFELELALEPAVRWRGLSGRTALSRNGGMLFVYERSRPQAMVMRDCPIPLDVAFLDDRGRVLAIHEMAVEPPRRPGESPSAYDARLPAYPSGAAARFAVEAAGGRLAELGLAVGDLLVFDAAALVARTRH